MWVKTSTSAGQKTWARRTSRSSSSRGTGWPRRASRRRNSSYTDGRSSSSVSSACARGSCSNSRRIGGVLVAEQELHGAVLRRLEARRRAQRAAELGVLGRRERGQHRPLLDERLLDVLDPGELLQRGRERVGGEVVAGRAQLVQQELEPQLGGLVLDDEQQLVVVDGAAARLLGREQLVEVQVGGVGQVGPEVPDDPLLDRPGVRPGRSAVMAARLVPAPLDVVDQPPTCAEPVSSSDFRSERMNGQPPPPCSDVAGDQRRGGSGRPRARATTVSRVTSPSDRLDLPGDAG